MFYIKFTVHIFQIFQNQLLKKIDFISFEF